MPKKTVKLPAYRHHKGSGQAIVQIGGIRHYLGKFGSEKSQERYRRLAAELMVQPITEQKLGRDNSISSQVDRRHHGNSDGRTRFPRELREKVYRRLLHQIQRLAPDLEVGLCLEEERMFDTLGLKANLGRCNCVL